MKNEIKKLTEQFIKDINELIDMNEVSEDPDYKEILKQIKYQFGDISYFNDKRKTFRRIKIVSPKRDLSRIEAFMNKRYPNINTYYTTGSGYPGGFYNGLCFKLNN